MHQRSGSSLVQIMAWPSHYLNQYWLIVTWIFMYIIQWKLDHYMKISIWECACHVQNFVQTIMCQSIPFINQMTLIFWRKDYHILQINWPYSKILPYRTLLLISPVSNRQHTPVSMALTLLVTNLFYEAWKYHLYFLSISNLRWCKSFKSFLLEIKDLFIMLNKYHGCWCLGDSRSQGISRHYIDLALVYYSFSTKRVNISLYKGTISRSILLYHCCSFNIKLQIFFYSFYTCIILLKS